MSESYNKTIAIIPPSGVIKRQDFALGRISQYLKSKGFILYLIKLPDQWQDAEEIYSDFVVNLDTQESIIKYLKDNKFDLIFHRSWMHSYKFASILSDNFKNIIFYIKDWMVEISREEYKFQFDTDDDYDGISRIFKSGNKILSHYSDSYTHTVWAKEYEVSKDNFMFFPEYTDEKNYNDRFNVSYDVNKVKLLEAGGLLSTSEPYTLINSKLFLKNIEIITQQKVHLHKMVLPYLYGRIFNGDRYNDYLYEDKFNDYFSIVLGANLNTKDINEYHFGIYQNLYAQNDTKESKSLMNTHLSKFAYYLEAGLPILVNESLPIAEIIIKHNIGIVISNDDIQDLKKVLDISCEEYNTLLDNVKIFRQHYSYNDITMKPILDMFNV